MMPATDDAILAGTGLSTIARLVTDPRLPDNAVIKANPPSRLIGYRQTERRADLRFLASARTEKRAAQLPGAPCGSGARPLRS